MSNEISRQKLLSDAIELCSSWAAHIAGPGAGIGGRLPAHQRTISGLTEWLSQLREASPSESGGFVDPRPRLPEPDRLCVVICADEALRLAQIEIELGKPQWRDGFHSNWSAASPRILGWKYFENATREEQEAARGRYALGQAPSIEIWICPNCRSENRDDYHRISCPGCGTLRPRKKEDSSASESL